MSTHSGAKIAQQMYTRERRGVYRSTEGFDTVAKSGSLDNNFVKKILHPFCLYDAPAELAMRGEKREAAYPAALHLFHTETNETVIGQSRYLAADFTGQRSAFFAHNFVVPASRADDIVQRYGDYLHADFAGSYTGELGGTLPELEAIPASQRTSRLDSMVVLRSLGIGEELFKALIQAVMMSVSSKKKIYVALDVPVEELSIRAAELTEVLLGALPFEFRRRLGVITYANEPKSRKYIHLTFVEKGALRPGDRSVEKDFTFDLASGRTGNADLGDGRQPYAELAWKLLARGAGGLDDFGRFADSILSVEQGERILSLAAYNELAVFYEIGQGNETLYADNKTAVLGGLLSYLQAEGALESRVRLNDLFLERFDREYDLIRQKGLLVSAVMESFKEYFILPGHHYKVKIVDYFINGMLNSRAAGREDILNTAFSIIESNDELSAAFFKRVLAQPVFRKQLFEPYMEMRLAAAAKAADIMGFVLHWGRFLPEALQQSFIQESTKEYLLEKLQKEPGPVAAVSAMHEMVDKAEKGLRKGALLHPSALSLLQELADAADRFLLNRISLQEMTQEQLLEISFLRYPKRAGDWQPPLDLITKQKANALRAAYRWFGEESPEVGIFAELTPQELDDVQLLGRRWLKEAGSPEPFERLPLAFYYSSSREGGPLDYDALLELVKHKAGTDKETVYRFLAWSQSSPLFKASGKKLWPGYRRAILKYFTNSDREAFKSRDFRKSYVEAAGPALQTVYNEARSQLASPLARWFSRSRFRLLMSGSIVGVVLIAAIIIFSMLRPDDKDASLAPQPSPVPSGQAPVRASLLSEGGAAAGSRLLFIFSSAEECASFKPAEISVTTGDKAAVMYQVASTTGSCQVPSPGAAGAGGTGVSGTGEPGDASGSEAVTEDSAGGAGADQEADAGAAGVNGGTDKTAGAGNNAGGTGDVDGPAATDGSSGDPANADTNAEGAAGDAGSANAAATDAAGATPGPTPAAGGTAPATGESAKPAYEVIVVLEPKAVLAPGSMITAGKYTLIVEPGPSAAPTAEPGTESGADPSAAASPEATPK
ncbi:glycosyltransferase [Paenibacillus albidus]|uniref:GAP1-N2 domain-containing protein n=1 Tax=Paenibacillus albidus TaxID=2041023 RepID=UPI001BE6B9AB|nr:glycosyltransferase [Paenibacillus albidus]MBT2290308.1 glycosyltransferase [Paenibacillus albidus]